MKKLSLKRATGNEVAPSPTATTVETPKTTKPSDDKHYKDWNRVVAELRRLGFKFKVKTPLSLSIYREIREAIAVEFISGRDLYQAIGFHVKSIQYLLKIRPNAIRYDIRGKKAGKVTEEESKHALKELLTHHPDYMRDRRKRTRKIIDAKPTRSPKKNAERHKPE